MNTIPFKLPLNREQFASALQKGQGRTLIHVRAVGLTDLEDLIVDACLHDQAYDPQCEDDRTDWLMEIVDASGAEARISQSLIPYLSATTDRFWDAVQRCRIAFWLARRGHEEARKQLYSCLRKWPGSADVIGAEEIVALDGEDGLVQVAEFLGRLLEQDRAFWVNDGPLHKFDEAQGTGAGRRILDAAAARSPTVGRYLGHLDEKRRTTTDDAAPSASEGYLRPESVQFDPAGPKSHVEKMRRISVADVISEIETEDPQRNRFWFHGWGLYAAENDLSTVLKAMIAQSEPGRLWKYLRVFGRRSLNSFDPRLLRYADHNDTEVRRLAMKALSNYKNPDVRGLAIARLNAGKCLESVLTLLKKNYQPGDAPLLERTVKSPKDRGQLHGLILELVELFQENQVAEAATTMQFVYEESPCSNCRRGAVKILIATRTAPDWILTECLHDSSDQIRSIARGTAS